MRSNAKISGLVLLLLLPGGVRAQEVSPVKVEALTCEHRVNPMGIGNPQPRLSWKLRSERTGEIQTAWEVRAASSSAELQGGATNLWDSGKVVSDQSVLVPWAGKPLESRSQVFWQVRVWDKDGMSSAWSDVASFELGLLYGTNDWQAEWITVDLPRYEVEGSVLGKASWINAGSEANEPASVRLAVTVPTNATIRRAMVDAAADGLVTIYVNGHPNKEGATSLVAPLHAEVMDQLAPGKNIIAIGSAPVRNAIRRDRGQAGRNAIAARVMIELSDGKPMELVTDGAWKAAKEPGTNWVAANFDDSSWATATVIAPYAAQPSRYWGDTIGPGRYLRKIVAVDKPVAKARLYATALGVYEASINGERVSDELLTPGWTDYNKRVMVQTYDVTKLIHQGANAVGAALGDGWYAGRVGWMGLAQYGTQPAFSAQLEITYEDGTKKVVATDDSWKGGPGEILGSDEQWGEVDDARAVAKGPALLAFENTWTNATVEPQAVNLVPQLGPPVRALMELAPQKITRLGEVWMVDFGQNLVGHVRLLANGRAGDMITVRQAEMTNAAGLLYTENLRTAQATDRFIMAGGQRETLEPHFTFHGFRYAEISGYPGELKAEEVRAVVVGSDNPPTGTFESSDADLNRLYENIVWSQRGNFLSVPTDCPQRDERLGWMGDAQVFAPTAARNADVAAFFTKWLVDVDDGQGTNGDFADVSPRVSRPQPAMPAWGDAGVIIPWEMYQTYGDKAFLADNYPFMKRWVDFSEQRARNPRPAAAEGVATTPRAAGHLILGGGVGDHLAPVRTPTEVVDTAYFANSAHLVAETAEVLGKTEDAAKYNKLFDDITNEFDRSFVSTNGEIFGNTQTGYILALRFGLLPEGLRTAAGERLAADVTGHGHVTGGFVGNGLICPTLTQVGRPNLAWQLVMTTTYPSWLFSVKNGATTIWERWDGWTPEHGFQDSAMNSFNHYSLGAVGAWLYSGAAGIQPDEMNPGYRHFILAPQFTSRLSHVKATFDSPYGVIVSSWQVEGDKMKYDVTVPPNSTATLVLAVPTKEVRESGRAIAMPPAEKTEMPLAAGAYRFEVPVSALNY